MVALAALAGWLLARRLLRPVDDMTRLASSIAASGGMGGRVERRSDDELGRLAATFDAMLERLEASFARERAFIGDVSHELRTAVGAMTAIAEVTLGHERDSTEYRVALQSVVRRGKMLASVIDDRLLLARADAGGTSDNLVGNALRHARSRMSLSVERRNGSVVISVDDDGPGIPADERDNVFRRFYRGTSRYEGLGIGLALSAAVARAYGGTIVVADSPLGGARFTVSLPLAP